MPLSLSDLLGRAEGHGVLSRTLTHPLKRPRNGEMSNRRHEPKPHRCMGGQRGLFALREIPDAGRGRVRDTDGMVDRPEMRASDADRDRIAAVLRDAHADGRLAQDELLERLDATYTAQTYGALDRLVADLPRTTSPPATRPVGSPGVPAPPARRHTGGPTNGMAIASMVLGIFWAGWIGSILAVVFGHVALKQIERTDQGGRGMAVAGLVLGYLGLGILALIMVLIAIGTAIAGTGTTS